VSTVYDLQILQGPWLSGWSGGYGINESGLVVGVVELPSPQGDVFPEQGPAIWLPNQPPMTPPIVPSFGSNPYGVLEKINSSGYAVGSVSDFWPAIVNGTSLIVDLRGVGSEGVVP
jgi:hypothetical protein